VFYVILFSVLAVLLVAAGVTFMSRQRRRLEADEHRSASRSDTARRNRKQQRAQSRHDRRKRT
jgi:hypothetical protein